MPLKRTVEPVNLPVSMEEIREHTNVTDHDDDPRLLEYLRSATTHIEILARKQFITQTWRVTGNNWPGSIIELPKRPLLSVTTVKYYDNSDTQQTVDSSLYTVDTDATPGRIVLNFGETWPSNRGHVNDIEVIFVCGFGASAASVPATYKHAIKLMVSHWNENREAVTVGVKIEATEVLMGVKDLYYVERDYARPDDWWDV